MNTTSLEARLKQHLKPSLFFLGVALGFCVCCVLGRQLPKHIPFRDFERIHIFLNPQTHYYPTALQIRTLARHELPRDRIAVIVGGNSILLGSGQTVEQVWTKQLQQELGDDYRVLNLALSAGAPNEISQAAVEMLCATHPRVLHVCNCKPDQYAANPDGNLAIYRYFMHDARARGLLLPHPQREQAFAALASRRDHDPSFDELLLQTRVNRWLSFNDLWQLVGYEACFTVWTPRAGASPWRARKNWPDAVNMPTGALPNWELLRAKFEALAAPYSETEWAAYAEMVRQSVPDPLRSRTLALICRANPNFLAKLDSESPNFIAKYDRKIEEALGVLRSSGLAAAEVGSTLMASDYVDTQHLSASGGAKLARELAPQIRDMAKRLGYENAENRK